METLILIGLLGSIAIVGFVFQRLNTKGYSLWRALRK